jgi:site-specific recombinase XerD
MPRPVRFNPQWSDQTRSWYVSIPPKLSPTGKRQRLFFEDRKDALRCTERLKERHRKFGTSLSNLDVVRLGEASEVYKLLDATGKPYSLISIVRESIERTKQKDRSVTACEAFQAYLDSKPNLSEIHRDQIQTVAMKFRDIASQISEVEPRQLEEVLSPLGKGSRNRHLRIIRAVFAFAVRKGWAKENVACKLDFTKLPKRSIEIFSNEQIQGMLNLALESEREMIPYFALGAFAGLRVGSEQLNKLLWSDIKFNEKHIVVRPELSKTGKRRFIPIADNLEQWLRLYLDLNPESLLDSDKRIITLPYGTLRKVRNRLFQAVSPGEQWIAAGLRHSYTSAVINSGKGIDETCLALGHQGNPAMLWNHYYLATPKEHALAYWQISP